MEPAEYKGEVCPIILTVHFLTFFWIVEQPTTFDLSISAF